MRLGHSVRFDFDISLSSAAAKAFVRDVRTSLSQASFLEALEVDDGPPIEIEATIPVNAALFGQQKLPFRSRLTPTAAGAVLSGLPLDSVRPGWAEVSGEAKVTPLPTGSRVEYRFDIAIHLALPEPDRWGGRALLKMIEYTAATVLERVIARFPDAIQEAARQVEASYAEI